VTLAFDFLSGGILKGIGLKIALGFLPCSLTHRVREQIMTSMPRDTYQQSDMNFTVENNFMPAVLLDLWLNCYRKPPTANGLAQ
jgi:hypothetical protein